MTTQAKPAHTPIPWSVDILNDKHVSINTDDLSFKDQYGQPRVLALPTCQDAWTDKPDMKFTSGIKCTGEEVVSVLENTEWIKQSGFYLTAQGERQLEINKANAALIVKAVNNHKKLVKELKDMLIFFDVADLSSNVCCCGSTNCNAMTDGHSFVDSGHYAIDLRVKSIQKLISDCEDE